MSPISQVLHKCHQTHYICKLEPKVLIHQDKEGNVTGLQILLKKKSWTRFRFPVLKPNRSLEGVRHTPRTVNTDSTFK